MYDLKLILLFILKETRRKHYAATFIKTFNIPILKFNLSILKFNMFKNFPYTHVCIVKLSFLLISIYFQFLFLS